MAKVNVYIDGFNLYYGSLKNSQHKWLDLNKLCVNMLPHDTVQTVKYFTAQVKSRPHDPNAPIRQQIYFRALATLPNISVIQGHFLTHSYAMPLSGVFPVRKAMVDKTEEKGSDVNLAAHILLDGFKGAYELAVLITNDSDLAEPVRMVRYELGLPVGILNPHPKHSYQLKSLATFIKNIRKSDLSAAQFAPTLTDATGTFTKPATW